MYVLELKTFPDTDEYAVHQNDFPTLSHEFFEADGITPVGTLYISARIPYSRVFTYNQLQEFIWRNAEDVLFVPAPVG